MKNNSSIIRFFINPFEKIAGGKALFIGLIMMAATSFAGSIAGVAFDGVVDVHLYFHSFLYGITVQVVSWIVLVLISWIAAKAVRAGQFRLVDLAGTLAFAEMPFFFLAFTGFVPAFRRIADLSSINLSAIFLFALVTLVFIGLSLYWMYRAFAVSTNLTKPVHIITFVITLFIAEASAFGINQLVVKEALGNPQKEIRTQGPLTEQEEKVLARTKEITGFFAENDINESITSLFNDEMLAQLPVKDLESTWNSLQKQFGRFQGFEDDTSVSTKGELVVTETTAKFERISFVLQLTFDENTNISGLHVKPKLF